MQQNHKNPPQNYNEIIDNLMLQDNKHIAKILQCSTRTIQRQRKDNKLAAYMLRHIHYILNSVYTLQNDLYNKSDVVISKMENTTKNMGSVKNSHTTNDIAINNATTMSPTPNYNGDKKRHSNDNDMSVGQIKIS